MHNHILTQCCVFIRRRIIKANHPAVVSHFSQSHLFQGGSVMSHQDLSAQTCEDWLNRASKNQRNKLCAQQGSQTELTVGGVAVVGVII